MAALVVLAAAAYAMPSIATATSAPDWTARLGTSALVSTIRVGPPVRVAVTARSLRPGAAYLVALRRGSCASPGLTVLSARVAASPAGVLARTLALTSAQGRLVRLPLVVRVGSRCAAFAPAAAPAPAPTPAPTPVGTALPVALDTWCDTAQASCASAYVDWSGSATALDQTIDIGTLGRTSYAALAWAGGYIGVQNGGSAVDGQVGPTAVFSLGGSGVAIGPLPGGAPNPNCEAGFDTGAGASCRIHLGRAISPGDRYAYRVTPQPGGWLRGEVVLPGGTVLWIADLLPGPSASPAFPSVYNFIEYFGAQVGVAADAPTSTVTFGQPGDGLAFGRVSRIAGVCATASAADAGTLVSLTTFGIGGCGS